jgi:hypothetical protein
MLTLICSLQSLQDLFLVQGLHPSLIFRSRHFKQKRTETAASMFAGQWCTIIETIFSDALFFHGQLDGQEPPLETLLGCQKRCLPLAWRLRFELITHADVALVIDHLEGPPSEGAHVGQP